MKKILLLIAILISFSFKVDNNTAQTLPFSQNWANISLITTNDDWSAVPGIQGFRGDGLTGTTGTDPQTIVAADDPGVIDINANQTNPNTFTTGGVTEFHITDPVVALTGSGTATAPYIKIYLNTTGQTNVTVRYNLRDIDGSADNSVQPVALHYRVGSSGSFTNISAAFVADASTGPNLATLVTPVCAALPAACDNQPLVEVRIMTTNAVGNDEWIGVDDIVVSTVPCPIPLSLSVAAGANAAEAPVPTNGSFTFTFTPATAAITTFNYTLNTGTATFNTDYNVTLSGGATPSPLVSATGTITVPATSGVITATITPLDDALVEGNETVILTISTASGGYIISPSSATITISDDDGPPTLIHDIQGAGTSAIPGNYTVQAIVTGVYPTLSPAGFYIQEEVSDWDANTLTSEGIFVVSAFAVSLGDLVRVAGTVLEGAASPSFNQAVIHTTTVLVLSTGNSLPPTVDITLPVTAITDYEKWEAMLVRFPGTLTVTDNNDLGSFGEVKLSSGGVVYQPTQIVDPNDNPASGTNSTGTSNVAAVNAYSLSNTLRTILLDDGRGSTTTLPYVNVDNTLRVGSTIDNITGILGFAFSQYRIQPVSLASIVFTHALRPAVPSVGGSNLKVVSFNVLNYFNGDGLGGGFPTTRGASSPAEFTRQRDKIIEALRLMDADVVGLIEMENLDLNNTTPALLDLVNGLNAAIGGTPYSFIDDDLDNSGAQDFGTDEIRCAIIYKSAVVTPVGTAMLSSNIVFDRPPLAQTFNLVSTNKTFNFIVNHFKSKGGCPGPGVDADQLDGQACWNNRRKLQSSALLSFINTTVIPASGTTRVLSVGDYNAYYEEDPMDILRAASYTVASSASSYSYLFDGQLGSLDHAVLSPSLNGTVTGIAKWNANSVEPTYLDYKDGINSGGGDVINPWAGTYTPSQWRASDHDAIIIGLLLNVTLPVVVTNFSAVKVNATSKISWTTAQEINSREFIIERSVDGGFTWQIIATVAAAGNSNTNIDYTAYDHNPAKGDNLYRLKSVDLDNKFNYSAIRRVNFDSKYTFSIYPNPASDMIQIIVDNTAGLNANIQIVSSLGQVLISKQINILNQPVQVNVSSLAAGMYFIKIITADGMVNMQKFTKR